MVESYKHLTDLQENVIPRLVDHGLHLLHSNIHAVMALEPIEDGKPVRCPSQVYFAAINVLHQIHCHAVVHAQKRTLANMASETTGIREELLRRFIESGERERLQEILRSKLHTSGWQDRVKDKCQKTINESEEPADRLTVDSIAEQVTPYAHAQVPEDIKAEILEDIRAFIYRALPEDDS
ncbi:hypothetical protein H4R20_003992 [Coemansia guatemalensis]|uniref:Transcription and mRNA export factor SUS1 n=1 Tax=Coemansia guatemalensis TaxID=2761395 RepID=A0A9W8HZG4_9FUNG|nr:hypothetical protein H4R20_003992 [Coemansia guatemalensis]